MPMIILASLDYSLVMAHEMVVPEDEKLLFSEPALRALLL